MTANITNVKLDEKIKDFIDQDMKTKYEEAKKEFKKKDKQLDFVGFPVVIVSFLTLFYFCFLTLNLFYDFLLKSDVNDVVKILLAVFSVIAGLILIIVLSASIGRLITAPLSKFINYSQTKGKFENLEKSVKEQVTEFVSANIYEQYGAKIVDTEFLQENCYESNSFYVPLLQVEFDDGRKGCISQLTFDKNKEFGVYMKAESEKLKKDLIIPNNEQSKKYSSKNYDVIEELNKIKNN